MLFNSLQFGIYFIVVTVAYFAIPHRYRWLLLLLASCYFYMAFIPIYILILAFTITVDYFVGIGLEKSEGRSRKWLLITSLAGNVGVLAFFKYFGFLNENLAALLHSLSIGYAVPNLGIILPIGLSFHTFQSMSYIIEIYKRRQKAEHHFGIFALYVMFYPQLVAGPIERPQHMLHQFYEQHAFDYERVVSGLRLIAWGLFKKVVIADRLAIFVNMAYAHPQDYTGFGHILATVFFAYQIYCDFSGYTDIARGSARVLGFRLMENFQQPYLSASIPEFWRRWHISLSSWLRDYVYFPLGGSRVRLPRVLLNSLIVFLLSGLWHGANWTFVVWGGLHGLYIIANTLLAAPVMRTLNRLGPRLRPLWRVLGTTLTFCLVAFAWIFFRAPSLPAAWDIVSRLFIDMRPQLQFGAGFGLVPGILVVVSIVAMEVVTYLHLHGRLNLEQRAPLLRWGAYAAVVSLIALFGVIQSEAQFIYFQF